MFKNLTYKLKKRKEISLNMLKSMSALCVFVEKKTSDVSHQKVYIFDFYDEANKKPK